ncbi:hypothetical protein AXFE_25450 [Acidithrix ferrooxidans]|uniref:Uncharacterized protein n=1 Tax=Acidithrix ferrooxidans TaxID=1280514 RepID=A0A0D8HFK8_9ACTN|nr:hypothetical protein AXFE_25450 [Acidithrix ferrooxidans]
MSFIDALADWLASERDDLTRYLLVDFASAITLYGPIALNGPIMLHIDGLTVTRIGAHKDENRR